MTTIDLLIPIHGKAIHLSKTLESLKSANLAGVRTIFILDRVSELVSEQCEKFCNSCSNSEILVSTNPGIVDALNLGISQSKGRYIARLDSDDTIVPDRFQIQLREFEKIKNLVLLGTQMNLIDDSGAKIGETHYPIHDLQIRRFLNFQNCIGHPSTLILRSAVIQAGGYRRQFTGAEDYDLWLRLGKLGILRNLEFHLTNYRISNNQFSKQKESNQGLVENSVRLANIGLGISAPVISSSWPKAEDLEIYNLKNLQELRTNNFKQYRKMKCIEILNESFKVKASRKFTISKIIRLSNIFRRAFFISPWWTILFLILKTKSRSKVK
jgi:glycosyltransferase involved in cell wall biosynthesis